MNLIFLSFGHTKNSSDMLFNVLKSTMSERFKITWKMLSASKPLKEDNKTKYKRKLLKAQGSPEKLSLVKSSK